MKTDYERLVEHIARLKLMLRSRLLDNPNIITSGLYGKYWGDLKQLIDKYCDEHDVEGDAFIRDDSVPGVYYFYYEMLDRPSNNKEIHGSLPYLIVSINTPIKANPTAAH